MNSYGVILVDENGYPCPTYSEEQLIQKGFEICLCVCGCGKNCVRENMCTDCRSANKSSLASGYPPSHRR